jgi:hypothetical protein
MMNALAAFAAWWNALPKDYRRGADKGLCQRSFIAGWEAHGTRPAAPR